jgi:hypothetical protein
MPDSYSVHHQSIGLPAPLRAELESDRLALAVLTREVEAVLAQLHPAGLGAGAGAGAGAGGWRGSASAAFERALTTLRQEIAGAAELIQAAERFTAAAVEEG